MSFWWENFFQKTNEKFLNFCPEIFCSFLGAFWDIFAQSICTLIFNLSGRPDILLGYPAFCQKARCKKQGHCYFKKKETRLPLLFLITMTCFFATCFLTKTRYTIFFQGSKPSPLFISRIKGTD